MNRSPKRKTRHAKNPVTIYLATVSTVALCFVGVASIMEWDGLLSLFAKPIIFACAFLVVAYTLFALRLGVISTIGHLGRVEHYTLKKQPFLFFFLVILYLVLSLPTTLFMGYLMIWQ